MQRLATKTLCFSMVHMFDVELRLPHRHLTGVYAVTVTTVCAYDAYALHRIMHLQTRDTIIAR